MGSILKYNKNIEFSFTRVFFGFSLSTISVIRSQNFGWNLYKEPSTPIVTSERFILRRMQAIPENR